jgi:hypothetical protein
MSGSLHTEGDSFSDTNYSYNGPATLKCLLNMTTLHDIQHRRYQHDKYTKQHYSLVR